jgi:hypothetical protein
MFTSEGILVQERFETVCFRKIVFSRYSRGESIVFNLRIGAIIHSDDATTRLRLVNNRDHYTLVE